MPMIEISDRHFQQLRSELAKLAAMLPDPTLRPHVTDDPDAERHMLAVILTDHFSRDERRAQAAAMWEMLRGRGRNRRYR